MHKHEDEFLCAMITQFWLDIQKNQGLMIDLRTPPIE